MSREERLLAVIERRDGSDTGSLPRSSPAKESSTLAARRTRRRGPVACQTGVNI